MVVVVVEEEEKEREEEGMEEETLALAETATTGAMEEEDEILERKPLRRLAEELALAEVQSLFAEPSRLELLPKVREELQRFLDDDEDMFGEEE